MQRGEYAKTYAQPLFLSTPHCIAPNLERALQALRSAVQKQLALLVPMSDQAALLPWLDLPDYKTQRLTLRLDDGQRERRGEFLFVIVAALDRWLVFTPKLPMRQFELAHLDDLAERATAVLSAWLKSALKGEAASGAANMPPLSFETLAIPEQTQVRLSVLELEFNPHQSTAAKAQTDRAGLGGEVTHVDGSAELSKVGRLLNALYPEHLQRGLGVDTHVAMLQAHWQKGFPTPLLLLGPGGVGKTTVLHEWLYRLRDAQAHTPRVWLLSPQRLMSGMSYLGQWEARLLTILKHACAQELVLYFDDLLGLFSAGISSGSNLTIGDLLIPWIDKKGLRVVAEITPETWRVLRERRRDFCDLFQVYPIAEFAPAHRWPILAALSRELEMRHQIRFELDVIPAVLELSQRFASGRAFPGNVSDALKQIAARAPAKSIVGRAQVVGDFSRRLGLNTALIDTRVALDYAAIVAALRQHLSGQDAAVDALASAVLRAKARVNDPKRPLAVMLLLGPTGVGKTQSAKALAALLQGTDTHANTDILVRFDLNEYVSPGDAARLVGTWQNPDGLLTSAIRRQPSCVLLFDEIEKATPEVFDVLLSLLDEGRLTDAHGRVADFTRAFILLTSNLGARAAQATVGFVSAPDPQLQFIDAAKRFFRPEFFNRIDTVIGFDRFSAAELRALTQTLVRDVLARSGLAARRCFVTVSDAAMDTLAALGLDTQLGARALKRGVERALVQPLAVKLASVSVQVPTCIRIGAAGGVLAVQLDSFASATRAHQIWDAFKDRAQLRLLADCVALQLDAIAAQLLAHPGAGVITLGAVTPATQHYFAVREQLDQVQQSVAQLRLPPPKKSVGNPVRTAQARSVSSRDQGHKFPLGAFERQAEGLSSQMAELTYGSANALNAAPENAPQAHDTDAISAQARRVLSQFAWLQHLANAQPALQTYVLHAHDLPQHTDNPQPAAELARLAAALALLNGCTAAQISASDARVLQLQGFGLAAVLAAELDWRMTSGAKLALLGFSLASSHASTLITRRGTKNMLDLRTGLSLAGDASAQTQLAFMLAHVTLDVEFMRLTMPETT